MTATEIIDKGRAFASELASKLFDPNTSAASKQVYFMDNHERIHRIMSALNQVVDTITHSADEGDGVGDTETKNLEDARQIIADMRTTIAEFQKTLDIPADVSEEDVANKPLTQEAMENAAASNQEAQQMMQSVNAARGIQTFPYSYVLMCDGALNLLGPMDNEKLTDTINKIANTGSFSSINLYKLQATEVPLKKKTVLTL